jgi:sugar/nucleoside kinase (ribokinase family)
VSGCEVVVVGDVMLDVVVKPDRDIAPTSDTPSRVRLNRGGAAANMAEALALAGHHVTYVGACGDDLAARLFEDALRSVGADVALEHVERPTGVVVAVVDANGQRAMMTDRGANSMLSLAHVLRQLDRPFDHLHVSGYTLLDPSTTDVGRGALARSRDVGRSTSIDVCSVAPLTEMTPAMFLKAALGASILFANEEEALALSGGADVSAAMDRLGQDFHEVMITQGESGARARSDGVDFQASSTSDDVIDTTGAGDAATGAYLALRLREGTIDQALEAAMTAASHVVRGLGSRGQSRT